MQSRPSVLWIGDHDPALESLRQDVEAIGYRVDAVGRSIDVKRWLQENVPPAIAILDCEVMQVASAGTYRNVAADFSLQSIPVIALLQPEKETIANAHHWAQDFVVKPFAISELLARVRALLSRAGYSNDAILRAGDIELDRVCCRVSRANRDIELSATDFRLLAFLLQAPGKVFSRQELIDALWGGKVAVDVRTVDVHIGRLRKALEIRNRASPLRTVRGVGYALGGSSTPSTGPFGRFSRTSKPQPRRRRVPARNPVGGSSIVGSPEQSN